MLFPLCRRTSQSAAIPDVQRSATHPATPPIIAPVLFAPEWDGWDGASTVVVSEALLAADVLGGRVVGEELVCSDGELRRGVDVDVDDDVRVGAGVMVNAE